MVAGHPVHIYNTHLDAANAERDRRVRRDQLRQLADFIAARSANEAVILAGDFNCDLTDPDDRAVLEEFAAATGLTRVDVAMSPDWREHLDYFFFRSGQRTTLQPSAHGEDPAFQRDGR